MTRKQIPQTCNHCQKEFKSGAGLALHLRWLDKPRQTKKVIQCARPDCSKTIEVNLSQSKRRKYCSKSCLAQSTPRAPMTEAQKKNLSNKKKEMWRKIGSSPKSRIRIGREAANKKHSQFMKNKYEKDPTSNPLYGKSPKNYRGWGCGQFVEDLGFWVRSTWERDYLLALKDATIVFEYEAKRFDLEGKGTYCPDVRLNGEDIYVEITGWDKSEKVRKRAMFKEIYGYPLYVWNQKPTAGHIADFVEMCKGAIQRDESSCA